MSLVKNNPSGQNFFMVVVRFLETFVGSLSAGQSLAMFCFGCTKVKEGRASPKNLFIL